VHDTDRAGPPTIADLGAIYERRFHKFLRVAEAIVGEVELANDVVQEAFVRAIRSRHGFRGEGSVDGWVWQTLVNTARNARRDRPLPSPAPIDVADEAGSGDGHLPEAGLRALIAGLPERQRLVLFLRYYADLDYRGIAEALGIQGGTVGATLSQAHGAIRRLLEEVPT
jgi:RNA polymerase sigma-70 factor, ECF subfamily